MTMKGAALIIGSLLWEDSYQGKDLRRSLWREDHLAMADARKVALPIHYGRYSRKRKCCTMTYFPEDEMEGRAMGVGYAVPFKQELRKLADLEAQGVAMARAEGLDDRMLRSEWMTTSIAVNPEMKKREDVEISWGKMLKRRSEKFQDRSDEHFGFDPNGLLRMSWPREAGSGLLLKDIDILIATVTVPRDLAGRLVAPPTESVVGLMNNAKGREYFSRNQQAGILTYQDGAISRFLEENQERGRASSVPAEGTPERD